MASVTETVTSQLLLLETTKLGGLMENFTGNVIDPLLHLKTDKNGFIRENVTEMVTLRLYADTKIWFKNGLIHRDGDKPALISSVFQTWYKDGVFYRHGDI